VFSSRSVVFCKRNGCHAHHQIGTDFRDGASHGGLPCNSTADAPFNPTRPIETSGAEEAVLKEAARDDDTINQAEEEDSICFEEF
jgi:hypothetical protein